MATLSRVFKFGNPNTIIKKAVNLLGYPVGDCRKPFNYLCDEGIEELKAGNTEFRQAAAQTAAAMDAMALPELDYFREHFLPSYSLTLDELE